MSIYKKTYEWLDRTRHILGVSRAVESKVDTLLRRKGTNYFYTGNQTALYVRTDGSKLHLDLRDAGILAFIATDSYESDVTSVLRNHLTPGSTYIDIGANLGIHAVFAARKVGQEGRVIAVEANPNLQSFIKRNAAINGLTPVIRGIQAAAWSTPCELEFSFEEDQHRVGAVRLDSAINYGTNSHKVKGVTIDDLAAHAKDVKVIKIDIEGREPFALEGAQKTIAKHDCIVVTEYHKSVIDGTYGAYKYDDLVRRLGLRPHAIERNGDFTPLEDWPEDHANLALLKA